MTVSSVAQAIEDFRAGKFVILVDDEDRENEGDLAMASQHITAEAINFMTRYCRGLICNAMDHRMVDRLEIPMMVPPSRNKSGFGTGFTLSVEAREGVTTGISAFDRARTIQVLSDPSSKPEDLVMPGHIFPLRAHPKGVLARRGQTEAGVDLAHLAGLRPAAVICEILSEDGSMARMPELINFGREHGIRILTVEDLFHYRSGLAAAEPPPAHLNAGVLRGAESTLQTAHGTFRAIVYTDLMNNEEHLVLCMGDLTTAPPLVRIHSSCLTGDLFKSLRCDCGGQLELALERIARSGGILIYLRQEGRGIGLTNKIRAYALQDKGLDTVDANLALGWPADIRTYDCAASILTDLGIPRVRLMTNNPQKVDAMQKCNVVVTERIPHEATANRQSMAYLRIKAKRMGHLLPSLASPLPNSDGLDFQP